MASTLNDDTPQREGDNVPGDDEDSTQGDSTDEDQGKVEMSLGGPGGSSDVQDKADEDEDMLGRYLCHSDFSSPPRAVVHPPPPPRVVVRPPPPPRADITRQGLVRREEGREFPIYNSHVKTTRIGSVIEISPSKPSSSIPRRDKKHGCRVCGERFALPGTLKVHMTKHAGPRASAGNQPDRDVVRSGNQSNRDESGDQRGVLESGDQRAVYRICALCGRQFADEGVLCQHMARQHQVGQQLTEDECDVCGKVFVKRGFYLAHVKRGTCCGGLKSYTQEKRETQPRTKQFTCDICNMTFARPGTLKLHKQRHSPDKSLPTDTQTHSPAKLQTKDTQKHSPQRSLIKDTEKHSPAKSLTKNTSDNTAQITDKLMPGKDAKQDSSKGGHPTISQHRPARFVCSVCKRVYEDYVVFKRHQDQHPGQISQTCGKCGRVFTSSSALDTHVLSRQCRAPGQFRRCDLCCRFFPPDRYLRHVVACRGSKHKPLGSASTVFHCDRCSARFTSPKALNAHRLMHGTARQVSKTPMGDSQISQTHAARADKEQQGMDDTVASQEVTDGTVASHQVTDATVASQEGRREVKWIQLEKNSVGIRVQKRADEDDRRVFIHVSHVMPDNQKNLSHALPDNQNKHSHVLPDNQNKHSHVLPDNKDSHVLPENHTKHLSPARGRKPTKSTSDKLPPHNDQSKGEVEPVSKTVPEKTNKKDISLKSIDATSIDAPCLSEKKQAKICASNVTEKVDTKPTARKRKTTEKTEKLTSTDENKSVSSAQVKRMRLDKRTQLDKRTGLDKRTQLDKRTRLDKRTQLDKRTRLDKTVDKLRKQLHQTENPADLRPVRKTRNSKNQQDSGSVIKKSGGKKCL